MFRRAVLPAFDSGFDVPRLLECGLRVPLTLMKWLRVVSSERAEAEIRVAKIRRLYECVWSTNADREVFCMASMRVGELTTKRASLAAGAEQAQAECDFLANPIRELEAAAAMRQGELGVVFGAV